MNLEVLNSLLPVALIALGITVLLGRPKKVEEFDERQLIEQGRGARYTMLFGITYVLLTYAGWEFDLISQESIAIIAFFGVALTETVYSSYCIFHDAYIPNESDGIGKMVLNLLFGSVWGVMALFGVSVGGETKWIRMALALNFLSEGMLYGFHRLIQRVKTGKEQSEE